jgi:uncharacterized repeat protein (TIGR03803 family)
VETVLFSFGDGALDDATPEGIAVDRAGNLYGAALNGGLYGYGAVFKLTKN